MRWHNNKYFPSGRNSLKKRTFFLIADYHGRRRQLLGCLLRVRIFLFFGRERMFFLLMIVCVCVRRRLRTEAFVRWSRPPLCLSVCLCVCNFPHLRPHHFSLCASVCVCVLNDLQPKPSRGERMRDRQKASRQRPAPAKIALSSGHSSYSVCLSVSLPHLGPPLV